MLYLMKFLYIILLQRITEIAGVVVSFDPKPIPVRMPFLTVFKFVNNFSMVEELKEKETIDYLILY
jgi:hypothetical protein